MHQVLKKIATYFIVILLGLYALIWLLSPYVLPYVINPVLAPYKLALDEGSSIRYNPLTAHIGIDDLSISKIEGSLGSTDKEQVFALKELEFEMRLYQFLFDDIYISEFYIDGLFISLSQKGNETIIAGVNLSEVANQTAEDNIEKTAVAEVSTADTQEETSLPYTLYLPDVTIKSSHVNIMLDDEKHDIHFKAFTMNDVMLALDEQEIDLTIESKIDDATFNLGIKGEFSDAQGEFVVDLDIQKYQLSRIARHIEKTSESLQGEISYLAEHTLTYNQGVFDISIPAAKIGLYNALYQEQAQQFELESIDLSFSDLAINFTDAAEIDLTGQGEFELALFKALDKDSKDILATLESLQIGTINLKALKSKPQIGIEKISFDTFEFSQTTLPETPELLSLQQLRLNNIVVTDESLSVDDISLAGINVEAHINAEKKLVNLVDALQSKPVESVSPEDTAAKESVQEEPEAVAESTSPQEELVPSKVFAIRINAIALADAAKINVLDESVTPHYQRNISIDTFTVGTIDNTTPDIETPIVLKGSSDKYASLFANVFAKPFLAEPEYKIDSKVSEVTLLGVSPYLVEALGYEVKSGQLDLAIKGDLKGDIIDSSVDLVLRGIELGSPEEIEVEEPENKVAADGKSVNEENPTVKEEKNSSVIPFDSALNYLKDSNDNIELSLPVSGDINDPSFGLSGFIGIILKKYVMSAAQDYLITAIVPYAEVVNIALSVVGDDVLKMTLNPLAYEAKQVKLGPEHHVFTSQFAAFLKEKPEIHIKACGSVTPKDVDKALGSKLSSDDVVALTLIAEERASVFKEYMIKEEGLLSSRILLCKAIINQEEEATSELVFTY